MENDIVFGYTTSKEVTTKGSNTSSIDFTTKERKSASNGVSTDDINTSQIHITTQDTEYSSNDLTTLKTYSSLTDVTVQNGHASTMVQTTQDKSPHASTTPNIDTSPNVGVYNLTTFQQSFTTAFSDTESVTTSNDPMSSVSYHMHSTFKSVVETYSTLCTCHFYEDAKKLTLVDWTTNMRRNLLISKGALSSKTRKLKSASDPLFSSYVIGMSGVSILVCLGVFFLLLEVSKIFVYRCKPQNSRFKVKLV